MKKNLFLVATALLLFAACQKDGVYNPKEKIATVTIEGHVTTFEDPEGFWATRVQTWTWEKNKLTHISEEMTNSLSHQFLDFHYDGDKISKIEGPGYYYQYTYKDNKIEKIEQFVTKLSETIAYQYEGGKVSTITITSYDYDADKSAEQSQIHQDALSLMLPAQILRQLQIQKERAALSGAKDTKEWTTTMNLTWDGDNIAKVSSSSQFATGTMEFTYDNKNNPYYHYLIHGIEVFSKNNVTKEVVNFEGSYSQNYESNYTYQYNKKRFPTSISSVSKSVPFSGNTQKTTIAYK